LRVHLRQRLGIFLDSQERKQVRQGVAEVLVEHYHFPGHLLAPLARVVIGIDIEVVVEQFDDGQVCRRLAVRDRERLEQ